MNTAIPVTEPAFVVCEKNGRCVLRLALPPGASLLADVVPPHDDALPLPDAVIDIDVARFAAALAVSQREDGLLHHVALRIDVSSAGFAGDILSPCLYLFTGSQLDLELHFYDAAVNGNGEYFLDLSQCFPFAEADALQAWLESLPAQA